MLLYTTIFSVLAAGFAYYFLYDAERASVVKKLRSVDLLRSSYDYIVVGAGTAGCVVAARLSERPDVTVLLVEAGDAPPSTTAVPAYQIGIQNSEIDWAYRTVPQKKACQSMVNNQCAWPRGKCLGGSGTINSMQHHYFVPDYDGWNIPGWSSKEVLPFFLKAESVKIPELQGSVNRGHEGPIRVTWSAKTKFADIFLRAAKATGHKIIKDHITDTGLGFSYVQMETFEGRRESTYESYLKPAMDRKNLDVLTNAHVTKITFDGNKATGIQFTLAGDKQKFYKAVADKEVILSAGSIGSTQLLMLSGVGPKEHLKRLDIDVVKHLSNVGQNLADHVQTDVQFVMNETLGIDQVFYSSKLGTLKKTLDYYFHKSLPLNLSANDINGHLRSGVSANNPRADVQIIGCHNLVFNGAILNLKPEDAKIAYERVNKQPGVSILTLLAHPKSFGEIKLASKDPFEYPLIDPKYLEDDSDVEVILYAVKKIFKIMRHSTFAPYNVSFAEQSIPDCRHLEFLSDDYFRCQIRHRTNTVNHHACTCRLGTQESDSVVDPQLRVHGIRNLRVADASVFRSQVTGNTNFPVIMVAEKAADIILRSATKQ